MRPPRAEEGTLSVLGHGGGLAEAWFLHPPRPVVAAARSGHPSASLGPPRAGRLAASVSLALQTFALRVLVSVSASERVSARVRCKEPRPRPTVPYRTSKL